VNLDSVFVFELDFQLPPVVISFIRLLTLTIDDWARSREKEKVPKAKVDDGVLRIVHEVLRRRMSLYPTSIQVRSYPKLGSREVVADYRVCGVRRMRPC
jgi:hypothetical protein